MNANTLRQIEEMKKQTIGVEVEMNNITRNKAAKIAADFFGNAAVHGHSGQSAGLGATEFATALAGYLQCNLG